MLLLLQTSSYLCNQFLYLFETTRFYLPYFSRNYKLFKPDLDACRKAIYTLVEIISYSNSVIPTRGLYLQISRNYKLFKLKLQDWVGGNLQISRNYKLFKLLHCHYSQF